MSTIKPTINFKKFDSEDLQEYLMQKGLELKNLPRKRKDLIALCTKLHLEVLARGWVPCVPEDEAVAA